MSVMEKELLRKNNSGALRFGDFGKKGADVAMDDQDTVAMDDQDTVWAAGLLAEPTCCLNVCQEQEISEASYQTALNLSSSCKLTRFL